ncbi:MAG: PAS domain S-box protein [Bacteroidales bacterium]|nr:PAS domain S-box protein [Bacteroidales bacterium]
MGSDSHTPEGQISKELNALEKEINEEERMFSVLFEELPYPSYLSKLPEGRIVEVNQAFEDEFGFTRAEVIGKTSMELGIKLVFNSRDQVIEPLQSDNPVHDQEMELYSKTGKKRVYLTNIKKISISGIEYLFNTIQNITSSKETESRLKDSYDLLRIAGEKAKIGGWNVILKDNRSNWSDEVAAIHEMPPGYAPLVEEGIHFYAPEWREKITRAYTKCIKEGIPYDEEMEIITVTGKRLWVRTIGEAIRNEEGEIFKIQGALQDITDKKKIEEKLRDAKTSLEEYFENDISADYLVSEKGEIFSCNRTFLNLFGFDKKSEVKEFDITNLYKNPEDRKKLIALVKENQRVENYEVEFVTLEGRVIFALINAIGVFSQSGRFEGIRGYIVDITEIKSLEKELQESEENYRLMFMNNPQPMWIYDLETLAFLEVNNAAINYYGYSRAEFISMTIADIRPPEDVPALMKDIESTRSIYNSGGVWRHTKKNGDIINVEIYSHSIQFNNRQARHVLVKDVTEQQIAEQSLIYNIKMQEILRRIASAFIKVELKNVDGVIQESLGIVGEFVNADRVYVFDYDWKNNICNNTYEWCSSWAKSQIDKLQKVSFEKMPQCVKSHQAGQIMCIPNVLDLPEMDPVRQMLERKLVKSLLTIPIMDNNSCIGFLGFESVRECHQYSKTEEGLLDVLAQMFVNISKRKSAEEEKQKLLYAVEQSPVSIIITNLSGNIEYVNSKTLKITGYDKEELIGENPRIFKSGEKPNIEYENLWQTISSGQEWYGEFHNKRKNGELFWEYASISPIFNLKGQIVNYVAIKEDISERKKSERIQEALVNISDAIVYSPDLKSFSEVIFSELTKIISTRNFYIALYNEQTQMFSTVFIFDSVDEGNHVFPASGTLSNYVLQTQKSMLINHKKHLELIDKGEVEMVGIPSEVWIGVPIFEKGKVIGVMVIQNYEGEKLLTEDDLRILEYASPSISFAIERKEFIENLKIAKEKAEQNDRLKSAFLANMSHEIRTPMNGILGFTTLLSDPYLSGEEKEEYIKIVHQSGQRMLDTLNDIIEISKIEAGILNLNIQKVDVNEKIEDLVRLFSSDVKKNNLHVIVNLIDDSQKIILTDSVKLNSILSNLIKNAIKYTENGIINIDCNIQGGNVLFCVKDTGIGIPKDRIESIFNRFEQADMTDTRAFQGSGLGLAIAKSYVEVQGGNIWVESEVGKGSTFWFTIPLTAPTN